MSAKRKSEFEKALLKIFNPDFVETILSRELIGIRVHDMKALFNAGRRAERRGKKR